jgi:hypothetical protein
MPTQTTQDQVLLQKDSLALMPNAISGLATGSPDTTNDLIVFVDVTDGLNKKTALSTLGLGGGGGGGSVTDGDKGDVSVSGSGTVWTIDNGVVSYAKMQTVSGASLLLGRGSSGSGAVQEITPGTGLIVSGTTISTDPLLDGGNF